MNTVMILSNLKQKRYENALDIKQGVVSAYTFLRELNHMFHEESGIYRNRC